MTKIAVFIFEASPEIGAGHAIRSCVLADALQERGWVCKIATTEASCQFIPALRRFEVIDPKVFYDSSNFVDFIIIDRYDLDESYERYCRNFSQKIMVIDDLANRKHDCDILLDQTYGREALDYKDLVPKACKILVGSDFILLRKEFIELRPKALEKRRNTREIKRILVSMGGSDPENYALQALRMIKDTGYRGGVDVALGFSNKHYAVLNDYLKKLSVKAAIHVDVEMSKLIYEADLAIGAAGGSMWERFCLGLESIIIPIADNQKNNFENFIHSTKAKTLDSVLKGTDIYENSDCAKLVDGFGVNRIINEIENNKYLQNVFFRKVTLLDKDMIYKWQNIKEVRQYFNKVEAPTYIEHTKWFTQRLKEYENPYWVICTKKEEIGAISLTYDSVNKYYDLSWYLTPDKCGMGLGTEALSVLLKILHPFKIHAYAKQGNIASHRALTKLNFRKIDEQYYVSK